MEKIDVAIVGAGAAGLMAAIAAGRAGAKRVVAFDGARRIGAKILISGGGRCNVTHHAVEPLDFNGSSRNSIARVLRAFPVDATIAFFRELGVALKQEETGKLFPVTDRAQTVIDALLEGVRGAGAAVEPSRRILAVERGDAGFLLATSGGPVAARRVILATGGRSVPKTGSDGAGYDMARALGHTVTPLFPALVPLTLPDGHWLRELKGIALDVELRVTGARGKILERIRGAMLCTHFGLSGPAVLDVSRHWLAAQARDPATRLEAALVPSSYEDLDAALTESARMTPRAAIGNALRRWLPERFADAASSAAGVPPETHLGRLPREDRRRLVRALTALELPVTGTRGFEVAEVTAGGVPLAEIDPATMESRVAPGLFLCGEILDVDGRIGGFNFQWAWASGLVAGRGSAR